jgi:hypothetical protein
MIGSTTGRHWWLVMVVLTTAVCGCGGGGGKPGSVGPPVGTCVNMGSASYVGTEDVAIASGLCPSYSNLGVTFTIVQAAGSCAFTLQSSLVAGTTFPGTVSGSDVSWTGSYPSASGTVTINSVNAVLSADLRTITGSFAWTYAGNTHCTGTTSFNVVKQ